MSRPAESTAAEVRGRLLARNTLLNLFGLGAPMLVAVAAIPAVMRGLGEERFGILAIAWMVIAYLGELGVGRATTKFVAEALGAGDVRAAVETAWTATALQAVFGVLCGIGLAVATPFLVEGALKIPPELVGEARAAFLWLAAGLPIVIVAAAWRGVLEAAQRFDLISAVRVPSTIANYLLPLVAIAAEWALPGVMAVLVGARAATLAAFWALAYRAVPALRQGPALRRGRVRELAGYGGWVSLSSVVSPILVYLDRLLLGVLVSMSAVAYYAAPYEVVNRLAILPASVVGALFPALSALGGQAQWDRIRRLASLSVKVVLLMMAPFAVVMIGGASVLLGWWLGPEFAAQSAWALVILTVGIAVNAVAQVPYTVLQGVGRADVAAKFHLLELPIHAALVWALVGRWGIVGAALSWTVRITLDAALLFWAAGRLAGLSPRMLGGAGVWRMAAFVAAALAAAVALEWGAAGVGVRAAMLVAVLGVLAAAAWRLGLSGEDRARLAGALRLAGDR